VPTISFKIDNWSCDFGLSVRRANHFNKLRMRRMIGLALPAWLKTAL
jgi:hypothetical protein